MKCHYEVLNLQKNAIDDEIKKSYRKLALKWHPDKNPDQLDECTKQFHLIQQAYEVLIDPQERAWYDKHREAILRGGLGHGEKYEDNCLDVYQYFNTACYSGYGDDEEGFYAVYRMVFEQIGTEDMEYMDEADHGNIPGFGDSTSDYVETVNPFYAFWESYCTAKSYVWQEKYDTREAPHRQVRRAMEQENKKLRDKAKKERNEEVRALVAFVRKRDKRVQAYKKKLEERAEEIKRLTEEQKKKQKEERLKKFENYKEADWSAMGGLEKDLRALDMVHAKNFQDMEEEFSDESAEGEEGEEMAAEEQEESFYDDLYCVACNKPFKTQKAFDNHENSKKHKQNIDQLKVEMEEEEQACDMNGITEETVDRVSGEEEEDIGLDDVMYDDLYCQYCDKFFTDELALYNHTTSKKHTDTVDSLRPPKADSDDDIVGSDSDNTKTNDVTDLEGANQEAANSENVEETEEQSTSKQSKKQKGKKQEQNKPPVSLNCNVCNEEFTSRNKLFQHVKETNHALRLPEGQTVQMTTTKSKRNKKNKKK